MPDRSQLRDSVLRALHRVAPEADTAGLAPDADLREELDIDSMDFLSFVTALHKDLGVDIPEADYPKLFSLDSAVSYLARTMGDT